MTIKYHFKRRLQSIIKFIVIIILILISTASLFAQSVNIVYPNGGERIGSNTPQDIKWASKDISNIRIEYSSDNGKNWNIISASFPAFVGNYEWLTPNLNSSNVIIRVYDIANNSFGDSSNYPFSIGDTSFLNNNLFPSKISHEKQIIEGVSLTLTYPNPSVNGEVMINGGTNPIIMWSSSGISTIDIDFSSNGGYTWNSIARGIPAYLGSYSLWTIHYLPVTQGQIRISGGGISSQNTNYFYVKAPQLFNNINLQKNSSIKSTESFGNPIKILPFGNSITFDQTRYEFRYAQDKISYRYYLWNLLRTNNYNTDFIGHHPGGYSYFPDPENEGVPGINTSDSYNLLNTGFDAVTSQNVTPGAYFKYLQS